MVGLDPDHWWTPGVGYVLGYDQDVVEEMRDYDLLSRDTLFNTPHELSSLRAINFTAQLEPLRDCKIQVTASQNHSSREEYYYKYLSQTDRVEGPLSYTMSGNYTTTTIALATLFSNADELFVQFLDVRQSVANRLAELNPDPYSSTLVLDSVDGRYYPAGYSANSQTVLLTSFLATYLGSDPARRSFSPFLGLPLPNWTVNYTGLNKIPALKKWFTNIALSHRYSATYTIGNFYTDASLSGLDDYDYGLETMLNATGDYLPPVSMGGIQLTEQLNPLIRLSLSMVNSFQFNFSLQKNRTLQLSFSNNQLTESSRDGVTLGAGYRIKDVQFAIQFAGKQHDLKSDIVLQLNITRNSNRTVIRKIGVQTSQVSSGAEVWAVDLSAEYALSSALTLRAFFQTNINNPYIFNTYANSTTKGGLSLRVAF